VKEVFLFFFSRKKVYGSGIAYTTIGATYALAILLVFSVVGIIPLVIVVLLGGIFTFCWTIVGAVSLWRDGGDCQSLNYPLWAVAMATVITQLALMVLSCFTINASKKN
jgi:hypothetical protein